MQTTEIVLPDLFSLTPFPWAGCNPSFSKDDNHSTDWILSYSIFTEKMRERLGRTRIEILGANTYNYADAKGLAIANDYIMLTTSLDELTDLMSPDDAKITRDLVVNAMKGLSGADDSQVVTIAKE